MTLSITLSDEQWGSIVLPALQGILQNAGDTLPEGHRWMLGAYIDLQDTISKAIDDEGPVTITHPGLGAVHHALMSYYRTMEASAGFKDVLCKVQSALSRAYGLQV